MYWLVNRGIGIIGTSIACMCSFVDEWSVCVIGR